MESTIKILIVEDEMLIGAKISMQLSGMGYEVTGTLPRGEEVMSHVEANHPDIILPDINLKGKKRNYRSPLISNVNLARCL